MNVTPPAGAYTSVPGWEKIPADITHRDVADVAVDSADRVYVLARMDPAVLVYEPDGSFVGTWGSDVLSAAPHEITIGPDDTVYVVDEALHSVQAYSTKGEPRFGVGPADVPSDTGADTSIADIHDRIASIRRAAGPYNRPTKLAVAPSGEFYVTDGYGNARIHHFDADGRLIGSWGEPGTGPGQFHCPHSLTIGPDGRIFVCDRENDRIQVFFATGEYLTEWTDFHRPAGICYRDDLLYIAELAWRVGHRTWRHGTVGHAAPGRITVADTDGHLIARFGGEDPCAADGFTAHHGICVDSAGDVYVAEVTWTSGGKSGRYPADCHTLVKLVSSL